MRPRQIVILVIGLIIAGVAAMLIRSMLQPSTAPVAEAPQQEKPVREVLVARQNLPIGQFIRPDQLVWQQWPEGSPIEFYFSRADAKPEDLAGAMARRSFSAGEPVTRADIIKAGDSGFLAAVLRPGMRAISIKVDAASSTAGLIAPGDLVDVILTNRVNDPTNVTNNTRLVSQTMLASARVLALDQRLSDRPSGDQQQGQQQANVGRPIPDTVTLEVTPKDAQRLAIAVRLGDLTLSLKAFARDEKSKMMETTAPDGSIIVPASQTTTEVTFDSEVSPVLRAPASPTSPGGLIVMRGENKTAAK
jgi:pilus assembly protein CpaB